MIVGGLRKGRGEIVSKEACTTRSGLRVSSVQGRFDVGPPPLCGARWGVARYCPQIEAQKP